MPWTFAHPAAAILVRRFGGAPLPLSGLVVGSLSPDFGYYVGAFSLATHAHTLRGTIEVCLPGAFVLLLILLRLRRVLVAPLPQPHRRAIEGLPSPSFWPASQAARMVAALWIGAMTHVAWDSFTHASGVMVSLLAPLREGIFEFSGRRFATYSLLQHAGTLLGIVVIGVAYCRWIVRAVDAESCLRWRRLRDGIPLGLAAMLSAAIGFMMASLRVDPGSGLSVLIFRGVIDSTLAFAVAYALLAMHAMRRTRIERRAMMGRDAPGTRAG